MAPQGVRPAWRRLPVGLGTCPASGMRSARPPLLYGRQKSPPGLPRRGSSPRQVSACPSQECAAQMRPGTTARPRGLRGSGILLAAAGCEGTRWSLKVDPCRV